MKRIRELKAGVLMSMSEQGYIDFNKLEKISRNPLAFEIVGTLINIIVEEILDETKKN